MKTVEDIVGEIGEIGRGIVIGRGGRGVVSGIIASVRNEMSYEYDGIELDTETFINIFHKRVIKKIAELEDSDTDVLSKQQIAILGGQSMLGGSQIKGLLDTKRRTEDDWVIMDEVYDGWDIAPPYPDLTMLQGSPNVYADLDADHHNIGHPFAAMYGGGKKKFR